MRTEERITEVCLAVGRALRKSDAEARVIAAVEASHDECRSHPGKYAEDSFSQACHDAIDALRAARDEEKNTDAECQRGPGDTHASRKHVEPAMPTGRVGATADAPGASTRNEASDSGDLEARPSQEGSPSASVPLALSAGWPTRAEIGKALDAAFCRVIGYEGKSDYLSKECQGVYADAALALFEPVRAEMESTARAARNWKMAHDETQAALTAAREENDELRSKAQNDGWHRAFLAVRNQAQRLEAERDAARAALEEAKKAQVEAEQALCDRALDAEIRASADARAARPSAQATREVTAEDFFEAAKAAGCYGPPDGDYTLNDQGRERSVKMAAALNQRLRAPAALQRETDEATVKVVLLCPTCSLSKRDALAVACGDRFHEWMRPAPEADGENGPWSQEQRKAARAVMDLGVNALCLSSMKRADEAVCGEIAKVAPLFVAQPAARGVVTDAMRAAIGLSPEPNKGVGYSTGREGRWSEVTVPYRDELAAQLAMLHWCQARKDLAAIDANTALAAPQKATEASVTIRLQDSVP